MPLFSAFTPFGHLAFSSKPAHGQSIYETLRDNFGDAFSTDDDSLQQARLYAQAMCLASSQYQIDRAANNKNPATATELLGVLERDYQVVPSAKATLNERRAYLSAVQRITRGNRREALEDALRTLLGADFVALKTTPRGFISAFPPSPGTVGVFAPRGAKKKVFALLPAIVTLGAPLQVPYTSLGGTDLPLVGETYSVDPDPRRNLEQVTIAAATPTTITATFLKSHEPGTLAARPHPYWMSNQRYSTVIVSNAAAVDPDKRRKVNELMARALRGVSTWAILIEHSGVFTCDDALLGLPDCVPIS